ncbi:MAG: LysR substrate-binding domain-containing protein, partial [Pseudomonadota bacterium]
VDEALERMKQGLLDLAILPVCPGTLPEGFEFHQILRGCNVIACRVGHPLTRRAEVAAWDVVDYSWIAPPANSPLFQDMRALLDSIGQRELKIGFTGGSLSAVLNVLAGSDSLTVLPYSVVHTLERRNQATALPIDIGDPNRHLGIITLRGVSPRKAAHRFADFVAKRFKVIGRQSYPLRL